MYIKHPDIVIIALLLLTADGVHLSELGNDIFYTVYKQGLDAYCAMVPPFIWPDLLFYFYGRCLLVNNGYFTVLWT